MSGANVDLEPEPATAELVGECDISRVEAPGASQSGHEIDDDLEQLGATAVDAATLEHRVIQNASKRKAGDSVSEDTRQGADARKERLSQQLKAAQEELNTVKAVLDADPEEAAPDEKPPKAASRPLGARSTRFRGGSSAKRKKQREELPVLDDEEEGALPGSKEQEDGTKAVDLTGDLQRALMEERAAALQRKVKHLQEAVRQLEAGGRRLQLQEADLFEEEADNSRPGLLETDRDRLIRTGVITPFAQVKGYEKRVQQRSRPAAVPDGPHAESIARVAQRIKEAAENRPRTVLVDASQTECDVPRMDPGFWRRHTHSAAPPPKRPKRQQTLPRAKRKAEAGGVSGADAEGGGEESGDEQGRASEAVQDLVAEMEDAEGEYDDAEDDFYEQRVAVAEERRLLEQEAADGEGGDTPGPSGSAAGGGGEDVEFDGGLRVPAQLFDQLFAYQKTGVKWLWELYTQRAGGIIADEMGLGKTAQVVAFLAGLHRSGMYRPSLVVCPATVLRQWMREVRRWYPPFRCIILHDAGRSPSGLRPGKEELVRTALSSDAGLLVTTYDQLRLQKALLLGIEWGCAVLDEGHKIRNPDADITLTCKQLATVHRYIMTGSPIQNRLTELWSLFDYVFPGKLGTLPVFQTEFSIPIQVGGYVNASRVQVTTAYRCALVLRDVIAPYLLRRIKADVQAQLPNKTEQVLFCKLTAHQRTLYRQYLASSEVSEILAGSRNALMGIDTLRKICNHPDLLERDTAEGSDTYGDPSRCGKLQVFLKVLRLWCSQGHKVLVFTQTQQMLDILQRHVHTEGLTWHRMDGSTSVRQRSRLIDDFNTSARVQVFLLTTRVGGLGVNLTGASRVVLYDPDWNPSTDMQARERAWRIGQKRDVTIYRLITSGTIEEKVYHRQVFKQFLTNRILRDPRQKRFFSSKGMADLFTLGLEEDESGASETASIFRSIQGEVLPPGSPAAEREPAAVGPDSAAADSTSAPATPPEQASSPGGGATPPQQRGRGRRRRSDEAGAMEEEEEAEEEEEEGRGGGQEEESRILQELFSATGITSALDHSKIESANDPEVLREDARAAAVASQAAEALRRSRRECQANGVHVPTWTGRSGEAGAPSLFNRRFGVTRNPALPEPRPAASTSPPAAGSSAAPSRPAAGLVPGAGAALSSQDLLARIQARRQGRATASSTSSAAPPSGASNTPCPEVESAQQMMTMIIDFLTQHGGRARSAHLIQHFDGVVPQQQLPVFRHVLKQVAVLNRRNGQGWWQLKPQHSRASAPETT